MFHLIIRIINPVKIWSSTKLLLQTEMRLNQQSTGARLNEPIVKITIWVMMEEPRRQCWIYSKTKWSQVRKRFQFNLNLWIDSSKSGEPEIHIINDNDSLEDVRRKHHSNDRAIHRIIAQHNSGSLHIEDLDQPSHIFEQPKSARKFLYDANHGK